MDSHMQAGRGWDDESLLLGAINGSAEAFGELYLRHIDAIYRYISFRLDDRAEAEDLTEEVFVRAWQALPQYRMGDAPFTSWLYRIAHNLTINSQRKRRDTSLDGLEGVLAAHDPPVEELVAQRQSIEALRNALPYLEDEEQEVILLRFVEGLPHQEVARIIGKSDAASRVIQHRALEKLNKLLR